MLTVINPMKRLYFFNCPQFKIFWNTVTCASFGTLGHYFRFVIKPAGEISILLGNLWS